LWKVALDTTKQTNKHIGVILDFFLNIGNQIIENIFYSVHKENVHGYGQKFPTDWFNITNNAYVSNLS